MATIQKRVVLCEHRERDVIRFHDWALVTTPLGVCAEPFNMQNNRNIGATVDFDATDEMVRVDAIEIIDMDREKFILSGGEDALIGGYLMPRTGR